VAGVVGQSLESDRLDALDRLLRIRMHRSGYRALVPLVVVAALIRAPGEVLLGYRSANRLSYPAVWDFPGGHVETGEQPLDALGREIREEIGVALQLEALAVTPDLRVHERDLDLSLWAVRAWEGEPVNCAPDEHDRLEWFDINHAITMTLAQQAYRPWLSTLSREIGAP
jgi:8-oxo-dGTP diphosphatase